MTQSGHRPDFGNRPWAIYAFHSKGDVDETGGLMSASAMDRVTVIKPGQTYVGKQGLTYGAGASAETVGAKHTA